jgi:hypothetical protein
MHGSGNCGFTVIERPGTKVPGLFVFSDIAYKYRDSQGRVFVHGAEGATNDGPLAVAKRAFAALPETVTPSTTQTRPDNPEFTPGNTPNLNDRSGATVLPLDDHAGE